MANVEKVIKGLECCMDATDKADTVICHCRDCTYKNDDIVGQRCLTELISDALELLKEQDKLLRKLQKDKDKLCLEVSEWKHKFHDRPLKEQEAVALKPHYIDKYGKNFICGVECGNCGVEISATYKFCPYCGRSVKWE